MSNDLNLCAFPSSVGWRARGNTTQGLCFVRFCLTAQRQRRMLCAEVRPECTSPAVSRLAARLGHAIASQPGHASYGFPSMSMPRHHLITGVPQCPPFFGPPKVASLLEPIECVRFVTGGATPIQDCGRGTMCLAMLIALSPSLRSIRSVPIKPCPVLRLQEAIQAAPVSLSHGFLDLTASAKQ